MTLRTNRMSEIILQSFVFAAVALIVSISSLCTNAHSAQTTLAWDPPVNADGTLFTGISGYRIHYGTTSASYTENIDVGNVTTYTITGLTDGATYYFAATDYDASGNESNFSNEVSKTFPSTSPSTSPTTYLITATSGKGGSITPLGNTAVNTASNQTDTVSSIDVALGANQAYTIAPATGYTIADVKVDGVSVGTVTSYTFSNVTANHTIAASFAAITYSVSATAGTGGSVTPSGSSTVNSGASLSLAIAADTGYQIADVVVDGVSKGKISSYSFDSVARDHTISATFARLPSMKGDVDGDGTVGTGDAMTALRTVIGATTLTADQATRADVWPIDASGTPVGDGTIVMADVLLILRRAIGLSTW